MMINHTHPQRRHHEQNGFYLGQFSPSGYIGIEVGYTTALQKPVLYVRHADAEHATTMGGLADVTIVYTDTDDLRRKLDRTLAEYA